MMLKNYFNRFRRVIFLLKMSTEDQLHSQILLRVRNCLLNSSFELPSKISRVYTTDTSIQNRYEAKYKQHDYDKKIFVCSSK